MGDLNNYSYDEISVDIETLRDVDVLTPIFERDPIFQVSQGEIASLLIRYTPNPLLYAMEHRHQLAASILIELGYNNSWGLEEYNQAYMYCLRDRALENLDFVIKKGKEKGLDINKPIMNEYFDYEGISYVPTDTALHVYAKNGNLDIVKILVDNGANLNLLNSQLKTPLYCAIFFNRLDVANYLLSSDGAIGKEPVFIMKLIQACLQSDNFELMKTILEKSDYAPCDGEGNGLLHWKKVDVELFDIIVRKFPDELTRENFHGNKPLHVAVMNGNFEIVEKLLNFSSVRSEIKNESIKSSVLDLAVMLPDDLSALKMAKYLIDNGAKLKRDNIISLKEFDKSVCANIPELYQWLCQITSEVENFRPKFTEKPFVSSHEIVHEVPDNIVKPKPSFGGGAFKPVIVHQSDLFHPQDNPDIMRAIGASQDGDIDMG